ncbi:40S ribosomal protein S4 [Aduncisulcus paluster]|uniref:40S ribosomal protein S4 n=1 Tax=Aduncisulcus paluster TaxID=2918883 RepID=A0ABQ5KIR5_9EUKA|nr:40S ribosomal protein S4 [Aduncisulcus paluster]
MAHLKRLNAPKHWMLDKMSGVWAPRPSSGPHNHREAGMICRRRLVKVDGKIRTDPGFPAGFQDVVTLPKSGDSYRLVFDVKGRFRLHPIDAAEQTKKLLRVKKTFLGPKGIPFAATHDGRTIRYPHPDIKANDTLVYDFEKNEVTKVLKFEAHKFAAITGGKNIGRTGIIHHTERHPGSFTAVQIKDAAGHIFATRLENVFIIGDEKPIFDMPKGDGIRKDIIADRKEKILKGRKH